MSDSMLRLEARNSGSLEGGAAHNFARFTGSSSTVMKHLTFRGAVYISIGAILRCRFRFTWGDLQPDCSTDRPALCGCKAMLW